MVALLSPGHRSRAQVRAKKQQEREESNRRRLPCLRSKNGVEGDGEVDGYEVGEARRRDDDERAKQGGDEEALSRPAGPGRGVLRAQRVLRGPEPRAESRHGHEGERSDSNPIEHHSGPLSPTHALARAHAHSFSLSLSSSFSSLFRLFHQQTSCRYQKTLFTMCAVKIVLAQLEGSSAGRGGSAFGSFNPEAVQTIYKHLDEVPLKNGDEWLRGLMQKDRLLALRLVEVRESYIKEGFEWDSMQKAAIKEMESSNIEILREGAESMFK